MLGSAEPFGFVNILNNEANILNLNISTINGGFVEADNLEIFDYLKNGLMEYYNPTTVVVMTSMSEKDGSLKLLNTFRLELTAITAFLVRQGINVVLCSFHLRGEAAAVTEEDLAIEELVWASSQLAGEVGAMHVDLRTLALQYLSAANPDDLAHSVLTLDGALLNERGHAFVAQVLITRLLYGTNAALQPLPSASSSEFLSDNAAVRERKRTAALKSSLHFMQEQDELLRERIKEQQE